VFVSKEEVEELATKNQLRERKKEAGDDSGWVAIGLLSLLLPSVPTLIESLPPSYRPLCLLRR
jgi:hypothetical protein